MEDKTKLILGFGMFILLVAGGITYQILDPENTYYCADTNVVGMCLKVGACTDDICKRCYFNESNSYQWKYCKTGWEKYEQETVIGNETELPTYIEWKVYNMQKDFQTVEEAEVYIEDIKKNKEITIDIIRATQKPYSNEIEVFYRVTVYDESVVLAEVCSEIDFEIECEDIEKVERNILFSEIISSKFPEDVTKGEVERVLNIHANEFVSNWKPNILVDKEIE